MRAIWQSTLPEYSKITGTSNGFEKPTRPANQSMLLMAVVFYREYSHRANFLYPPDDNTPTSSDTDSDYNQYMKLVFLDFKESTDTRATFVSHSETVVELAADPVIRSLTYSMFSELLCDHSKNKSKNSRVLLAENPKRELITKYLAAPLGEKVADTLAQLQTINSTRGLRTRMVAEKVTLRELGTDGAVVSTLSLDEGDSKIFALTAGLVKQIAFARDGLGTLRIRHERSFKTLATKKRLGVWEFLSDAIIYFTKRSRDNLESAIPVTHAQPGSSLDPVDHPATPSVLPSKKFVAITALFQKYGQAKSLKDSEKKQSYQIPVSEALLIVEVEDRVGEKGVISTPLLTSAQFLYVKALSGVMTSTVKERMQAVQSVLFQYEVETEMEEVNFLAL